MLCIDSDILIDFLRGKQEAVALIQKHRHEIVTTELNVFEIFLGIYDKSTLNEKELQSADLLLSSFPILQGSFHWGKRAAQLLSFLIKKGKVIEERDCFIASIMLSHGCHRILTGNSEHFLRVPGIEVISY